MKELLKAEDMLQLTLPSVSTHKRRTLGDTYIETPKKLPGQHVAMPSHAKAYEPQTKELQGQARRGFSPHNAPNVG